MMVCPALLLLLVMSVGAQNMMPVNTDDMGTTPVGAQEIAIEVVAGNRLNLPRQPIQVEGMEADGAGGPDEDMDRALGNDEAIQERDGSVDGERMDGMAHGDLPVVEPEPRPAAPADGIPVNKTTGKPEATPSANKTLPGPRSKNGTSIWRYMDRRHRLKDTKKQTEQLTSRLGWFVVAVMCLVLFVLLVSFILMQTRKRSSAELPTTGHSHPARRLQDQSHHGSAGRAPA